MIIGLCGYAQSGKDTVGSYLVDAYGFERIAFADAMRKAMYVLNPHVGQADLFLADLVDQLGWDEAKQYAEVRGLLQRFGTEVGREMFGNDFWVEVAFQGVKPDSKYVITDVRFPNEQDSIVAAGGDIWKVTRPGYGPVNAHVSDNWDFAWDTELENLTTIQALQSGVDVLMALQGCTLASSTKGNADV